MKTPDVPPGRIMMKQTTRILRINAQTTSIMTGTEELIIPPIRDAPASRMMTNQENKPISVLTEKIMMETEK